MTKIHNALSPQKTQTVFGCISWCSANFCPPWRGPRPAARLPQDAARSAPRCTIPPIGAGSPLNLPGGIPPPAPPCFAPSLAWRPCRSCSLRSLFPPRRAGGRVWVPSRPCRPLPAGASAAPGGGVLPLVRFSGCWGCPASALSRVSGFVPSLRSVFLSGRFRPAVPPGRPGRIAPACCWWPVPRGWPPSIAAAALARSGWPLLARFRFLPPSGWRRCALHHARLRRFPQSRLRFLRIRASFFSGFFLEKSGFSAALYFLLIR